MPSCKDCGSYVDETWHCSYCEVKRKYQEAYERGRREAFEEAAKICHNGADRRRIREYAAEEGRDEQEQGS